MSGASRMAEHAPSSAGTSACADRALVAVVLRWLLICAPLTCSMVLAAAVPGAASAQTLGKTVADLSATSLIGPSFLTAPVPPAPSANPGGEFAMYSFEISISFKIVRFRSMPFDATLFGIQTSIVYFPKRSSLGFETNCTHAWGTHVFADEQSRFWLYGSGLRWGRRGHRWEPFAHGLIGGVRAWPQTALGSPNALALQLGGGSNVPLLPHLSLQMSGDYVRTFLYGTSQNHLQAGFGIVIPF